MTGCQPGKELVCDDVDSVTDYELEGSAYMVQSSQPVVLCTHCLAPIPVMRSRHMRGLQRHCSGMCAREAAARAERMKVLAKDPPHESDHWKGG